MTILVVDDEQEIADLVEVVLQKEGHTVYKYYNGADALNCIRHRSLDLAILDVMLPDIDGFSILREIRKTERYPVIMLTAKTEQRDKREGFAAGADDYVTKPFDPEELGYRVRAALRRYTDYNSAPDRIFESGGLFVDRDRHICTLLGNPVTLTPTEFNILWLLCERAGNVVSPKEIFEEVWQQPYLGAGNTVMVHIRRIREKLGEPSGRPKFIKTVWGVGYKVEKR